MQYAYSVQYTLGCLFLFVFFFSYSTTSYVLVPPDTQNVELSLNERVRR